MPNDDTGASDGAAAISSLFTSSLLLYKNYDIRIMCGNDDFCKTNNKKHKLNRHVMMHQECYNL